MSTLRLTLAMAAVGLAILACLAIEWRHAECASMDARLGVSIKTGPLGGRVALACVGPDGRVIKD